MINPRLFQTLKAKAEHDVQTRARLDSIVESLEKNVSYAQGVLSRVHSTPREQYPALLRDADAAIYKEIETISQLNSAAMTLPYYKFNGRWTRPLQDAIFTILMCAWLGGLADTSTNRHPDSGGPRLGRLFSFEEVGTTVGVAVDTQLDEDGFHIALDEYLSAVTSLADELSRLAMNAVTLGDAALAVHISQFVKELHSGFQLLNLKNDFLRKRVDGVKYAVKKVEGVIYDLALRNLLPADAQSSGQRGTTGTAGTPADKSMSG